MRKNQAQKGFTLVELLVVIAIIAVLATIILPGMGKIRLKAKMLKCSNNLKGLYAGLCMYEMDYRVFPRGNGDEATGANYWNILRAKPSREESTFKGAKDKDELYICPIRGGVAEANTSHYMGPVSEINDATEENVAIAADEERNHTSAGKDILNDISVLYFGGIISTIKYNTEDWSRVTQEQLKK